MIPLRVVFKNLTKHWVRTSLTVGSLFVALFLVCFLKSFVESMNAGVKHADVKRLVVQSSASLFVQLPEAYRSKIAAVEGVGALTSWTWIGGHYQKRENFFPQFAVDAKPLPEIYPEMKIIEGTFEAFEQKRNGCIIGDALAKKFPEFKIGAPIKITAPMFARADGKAWEYEIAAIYHSDKPTFDNSTMFFHQDFLTKSIEDKAATGPVGVSLYVIKVADGASSVAVMKNVDELFEHGPQKVQTTTEAEFSAQFVSMMGNIPFFVSAIGTGVLFAILLAVVNTMLMAAREQTRDSGILKALGFTNASVFSILLLQSIVLVGIGGGLGILAAHGMAPGIRYALQGFSPTYEVSRETTMLAIAMTLAIGLIAGTVPAIRLAQLSPVNSLRAEN